MTNEERGHRHRRRTEVLVPSNDRKDHESREGQHCEREVERLVDQGSSRLESWRGRDTHTIRDQDTAQTRVWSYQRDESGEDGKSRAEIAITLTRWTNSGRFLSEGVE